MNEESPRSDKTENEKSSFIIHKFRVHYFFTEMWTDLSDFLKNTEIEMWITTGDWKKPLCKASCFPLSHFEFGRMTENSDKIIKLQSFQPYFFGESVDPFYINLTCGLIKDNEIKDADLKIYNYNRIFFPDNFYYNSDPVPIEWLELFEDRNDILSIYEKEVVLNKIGVNPFSSKKELDYLGF